MERRHFLKLAFGVAAGTAALAAGAHAVPLTPQPLAKDQGMSLGNEDAHLAVVTGDEVNRMKPEQVRWGHHGHGHHWGWHRRHWGWRHRHWGWRHRRWHRRHW
jgi:hypothetical protein